MKKAYWIPIFALAVGVLDAGLKAIALERLPENGGRLTSPVDFALHKNPGIAFNIPIPLWIILLLTIGIALFFLYFIFRYKQQQPAASAFSAVILIGALGNAVDRIVNGFTTDYIILFARSAINLSDILIVVGILGFLWYSKDKAQT